MNSSNSSSPPTPKQICSNCLKQISNFTHHIECVETMCPDTQLCLDCFSLGKHTVEHSYKVHFDGVSPGWSLEEDVCLLQAMEQCGYGSWEEVARQMPGKPRTPRDIKHHFDTVFVNGASNIKILKDNSFNEINSNVNQTSRVQYFPSIGPSDDPPRPGPSNPKLGGGVNNFKSSNIGWSLKLPGYSPARAEFTQEWDNQAESVLSLESGIVVEPLHINAFHDWSPEEQDLESELKLGLISIYNNRLTARKKVKRLVREHSLIHKVKVGKGLARLRSHLGGSSWDVNQFVKFSQLLCAVDMDFLLEGFLVEMELRSKVLHLQEIRKSGVKMSGSAELMETLVARRRENIAFLGTEKVQDWLGGGVLLDRRNGSMGGSKRAALPLDIVSLPGCEKLSEEERELCSNVRVVPNTFIEIKEVLMGECEKNDGIRLADARGAVKIDVNKTRRIYDFLLQHGSIWPPKCYTK